MIKNFKMTDEQFKAIMEASKPVPYMIINGKEMFSQQENANAAWQALGKELGFDYMTVKPNSKGDHYFTAEEI